MSLLRLDTIESSLLIIYPNRSFLRPPNSMKERSRSSLQISKTSRLSFKGNKRMPAQSKKVWLICRQIRTVFSIDLG